MTGTVYLYPPTDTHSICMYCLCSGYDMQDSQLRFMCELFWGIKINQYCDLWHFCVKIPQVERKSRGLWDMAMFTFRAHTLTSSSALVALRIAGESDSLSLLHTHTLVDWPCFCSTPKRPKPERIETMVLCVETHLACTFMAPLQWTF